MCYEYYNCHFVIPNSFFDQVFASDSFDILFRVQRDENSVCHWCISVQIFVNEYIKYYNKYAYYGIM